LTILLPDLMKQFNKPTLLGARDVTLTKAQMDAIATALTEKNTLPDTVPAINDALADIIRESENELQDRFSLDFATALRTTDISAVAEWESTADFLEIANHKSNAELRISAGASLMTFLGDGRFGHHLLSVIDVDAGINDVDAVIARRALSQFAGVAYDAGNWREAVESKLS
ncbi:MAG: hypothetical protein AAF126_13500, partial [Chloroflexota bacterium]